MKITIVVQDPRRRRHVFDFHRMLQALSMFEYVVARQTKSSGWRKVH